MNQQKEESNPKTYRKTKFASDHYFFDWFGANMPAAKEGFTGTDLDLVIRDKSGNIMFLEIKRKGADVKTHQSITFQILDKALRRLNGETISVKAFGRTIKVPIKYKGFKLLQFENTTFENGQAKINGEIQSEAKIRSILSFGKK